MTELDLLNAIADGRNSFCRSGHPDLEAVDRHLRAFADRGYVVRIVRAVSQHDGAAKIDRVDVIGGLTPIGEMRRGELSRMLSLGAGRRH